MAYNNNNNNNTYPSDDESVTIHDEKEMDVTHNGQMIITNNNRTVVHKSRTFTRRQPREINLDNTEAMFVGKTFLIFIQKV